MADAHVTDPIVAALKRGNAEEAEGFCKAALAGSPDDAELLQLLALSLQRRGRTGDALEPLARLTRLYPKESAYWFNYATALYQLGQHDLARLAAGHAVDAAPDDHVELERLGLWCGQLGALRAAAAALQRAVGLAPESAKLQIEAAKARVAAHDILAGEGLRAWRAWAISDDGLLLDLANLLAEVGEPWDALEILVALTSRKPTDWFAQLLRAKLCERVNQLPEAESRLDWIEAMQPAVSESIRIRREIAVQRAQLAMRRHDPEVARRLLEAAGPRDAEDSGYYFALARTYDRLGESGMATGALREAHRLQVADLRIAKPYLLAADAPLLPGVDDRVTADEYRNWPTLRSPDANQSPVFVVGFPRSGTTLLEQMLDAHPRLQSMDERPFLNILSGQLHQIGVRVPHDLGKLNQQDCDELRKGYVLMGCSRIHRRWNTRLVDKNPLNMLWLPMLHRLFPHAKIILAIRHPCDALWSCYLQNFRSATLQAACRSLEHLALAYVAAMDCWLHHAAIFGVDVLVSRYEDLVEDPVRQVHRVAGFLGLDGADAMLEYATRAREKGYIKTPSYTQVIEPINARSVGRWHQYGASFESVLPILQPMLKHWSYTQS